MEKPKWKYDIKEASTSFYLDLKRSQNQRMRATFYNKPDNHLKTVLERLYQSSKSTNGSTRTSHKSRMKKFPSLNGLMTTAVLLAKDVPEPKPETQVSVDNEVNHDEHNPNAVESECSDISEQRDALHEMDYKFPPIDTEDGRNIQNQPASYNTHAVSEKYTASVPKSSIPNSHCSNMPGDDRLFKLIGIEYKNSPEFGSDSLASDKSFTSSSIESIASSANTERKVEESVKKAEEANKYKQKISPNRFINILVAHKKSSEKNVGKIDDPIWKRQVPSDLHLRDYKSPQPTYKKPISDENMAKRKEVLKKIKKIRKRKCMCPPETVFTDYSTWQPPSYNDDHKNNAAGESKQNDGLARDDLQVLAEDLRFNIERFMKDGLRPDETTYTDEKEHLGDKSLPAQKTRLNQKPLSDQKTKIYQKPDVNKNTRFDQNLLPNQKRKSNKKVHFAQKSDSNQKTQPDQKPHSYQKDSMSKKPGQYHSDVAFPSRVIEKKQLPKLSVSLKTNTAKQPVKEHSKSPFTSSESSKSTAVRFALPAIPPVSPEFPAIPPASPEFPAIPPASPEIPVIPPASPEILVIPPASSAERVHMH